MITAQFIIMIKQQNYGWSCSQLSGADRVFALKEQAIHFARQQCASSGAEIRIRQRNGAEQKMTIAPEHHRRVIPFSKPGAVSVAAQHRRSVCARAAI